MFQRVEGFLAQPFTSVASNTSWVLMVGLVLVVAYLWRDMLEHIKALA